MEIFPEKFKEQEVEQDGKGDKLGYSNVLVIIVDNDQVEVNGKFYDSFNNKENMIDLLIHIINFTKYPGNHLILYRRDGENKREIGTWS